MYLCNANITHFEFGEANSIQGMILEKVGPKFNHLYYILDTRTCPLANSANPDEMPHSANGEDEMPHNLTFHQNVHRFALANTIFSERNTILLKNHNL